MPADAFAPPLSHAFDLHAVIPYHSLPEEDREKYWDDGVHLSSDGYDWMGGHIADHLIELISKQRSSVTPQRRPRRLARPEDEAVTEEEQGHPSAINQGYVIVRRRDLD